MKKELTTPTHNKINGILLMLVGCFILKVFCMSMDITKASAQPTDSVDNGAFIPKVGTKQSKIQSLSMLPKWSSDDGNRLWVSDLRMTYEWRASDSTWWPVTGNDPTKVRYADTAAMISPYLRNALGVKYADTASMQASQNTRIDQRVKYTDTATMLSPYAKTSAIPSITGKLNISDTSTMLTPYQRKSGLKIGLPLSGTTNSSGIATFTYPSSYSVIPNVQFQIGLGGTNKQTILLTSSTTTGCTLYVQLRADVLGLLPSYSDVNAAKVDILVTEK